MTELDEIANKAVDDIDPLVMTRAQYVDVVKKAIYSGIRAFAEQEPSEEMNKAGDIEFMVQEDEQKFSAKRIFKAMMAEALKTLPQQP